MRQKPVKPREDFPLYAHAAGMWAKKINGRTIYFGPWGDPIGAEAAYKQHLRDQHRARSPVDDDLDMGTLLNLFLERKHAALEAGEITQRTWKDYHATCQMLKKALGVARLVADLAPQDFEVLRKALAERHGPIPLRNQMQRVRSVFKLADDDRLLSRPVHFGGAFKSPSKRVMRQSRHVEIFTATELRKVIKAAGQPMLSMALLGINCAFGNNDVGALRLDAINLQRGWVEHPRPKTGVARRAKLWPETVKAMREAIKLRPEPKKPEAAELVFVTKYGASWGTQFPVTLMFGRLLAELKIERPALNFYALRRTFATVASGSRDQVAVNAIMGHLPPDDEVPGMYRLVVEDDRLAAVAAYVRRWVFEK